METQTSTKPEVQIRDCYLETAYSGNQILTGIPEDYPDEHQGYPGCLRNGQRIYTSQVVKAEGDTVETLRTIYKVKNWITNPWV
jgi:hypothetical protein